MDFDPHHKNIQNYPPGVNPDPCPSLLQAILFWATINMRHGQMKDKSKFPAKCDYNFAYSLQKKGRIDPPLPENYFGNTICIGNFSMPTQDLVQYNEDPSGPILKAAELSRKAVDMMNRPETVHEHLAFMQALERKDLGPPLRVLFAQNLVMSTNWCAFQVINPRFSERDDGNPDSALFSSLIPNDVRGSAMEGFYVIRSATQGRTGFDVLTTVKRANYDSLVKLLTSYSTVIPKSFA